MSLKILTLISRWCSRSIPSLNGGFGISELPYAGIPDWVLVSQSAGRSPESTAETSRRPAETRLGSFQNLGAPCFPEAPSISMAHTEAQK